MLERVNSLHLSTHPIAINLPPSPLQYPLIPSTPLPPPLPTRPLLTTALSLLETVIRDDPSPPMVLTHMLGNGLVYVAWRVSSPENIPHDEDSLTALIDFIFA